MLLDRLESFGLLRDVDSEAHKVTAVISTGDIARDGAIIDPSGWDFTNYDHNPVVLWMHNDEAMPFARTIERITTEKELIAKAQFDLEDPLGAIAFRKIQKGYINATSVRWLPRETEVRTVGEGKEKRDVLVFTNQELLEWSFVTVGSDTGALIVRADGEKIDLRDFLPDEYRRKAEPTLQFKSEPWMVCPECNGIYNSYYAKCLRCHVALEDRTPEKTDPLPRPTTSSKPSQHQAGHCDKCGLFHEGTPGPKPVEPLLEQGPSALQRITTRITSLLSRRLERPSTDDLIVLALMKATGKTEERIREEISQGGYRP